MHFVSIRLIAILFNFFQKRSIERSKYYQWTFFIASTVDEVVTNYLLNVFLLPEEQRNKQVAEDCHKKFVEKIVPVLEEQLKKTKWLLSDEFSAVDVILAYSIANADKVGLLKGQEVLVEYIKRCYERPAYLATYGGN